MAREPSWELRAMCAEDLDEVLALERASFGDPWHRESFLAEIRGASDVRWPRVAVGPLGIAGYVIAWFVADEVQVANLAVAPGMRRKGLGRHLLVEVFHEARRRGCRWVNLEVRPSNAAARALYEGLGFRVAGRRRHYYVDTGEDALVMRLDLHGDVSHS